MNHDRSPIPPDDIMEWYSVAEETTRQAVSFLLRNTSLDFFLSVSERVGLEGTRNQIDVEAHTASHFDTALVMLSNIAYVGKMEFGNVWLNEVLKNLSSQMM